MFTIKEMKLRLLQLGRTTEKDFVGCTDDEIQNVKNSQRVKYLPSIYEEFLSTMGRAAGDLFIGTNAFFPDLLRVKETALMLLEDCNFAFQLPDNVFVLSEHQGYQFHYFECNKDVDDPPVWWYIERKTQPEKISESLSDYFEDIIIRLETTSKRR